MLHARHSSQQLRGACGQYSCRHLLNIIRSPAGTFSVPLENGQRGFIILSERGIGDVQDWLDTGSIFVPDPKHPLASPWQYGRRCHWVEHPDGPLRTVANIISGCTLGLATLHGKGYFHRDFKVRHALGLASMPWLARCACLALYRSQQVTRTCSPASSTGTRLTTIGRIIVCSCCTPTLSALLNDMHS